MKDLSRSLASELDTSDEFVAGADKPQGTTGIVAIGAAGQKLADENKSADMKSADKKSVDNKSADERKSADDSKPTADNTLSTSHSNPSGIYKPADTLPLLLFGSTLGELKDV